MYGAVSFLVLLFAVFEIGEPGCWDISSGGLAQLARALAWHARGHRFDPDILHVWHDCDIVVVIRHVRYSTIQSL